MAKNNLHFSTVDSRILIVGLITPNNLMINEEAYFQEFESLIKTNGITPAAKYFTKLRSIHPGTFVTKGKLEEIAHFCANEHIDEVILSEPLSPRQEYALTRYLGIPVFDRNHLILEIFEKGAVSAEGKLQVQIAFLQHRKSRLAGQGKTLSQQGGGIGTRGPGETQKESDMQHIDHLLLKLERDLVHLKKVRDTQRKQRIKSRFPLIAIIGYTNAGKSTLLNNLTHSEVLAQDKLFATLDTTTRELFIDGKKVALISDTVGFIQNLPHTLIEAFKSTLDELQYAHILLHVVDLSNKDWRIHIEIVHQLLDELEIKKKKMIYVFNKIDKLSQEEVGMINFSDFEHYVCISAADKESLPSLRKKLLELLEK